MAQLDCAYLDFMTNILFQCCGTGPFLILFMFDVYALEVQSHFSELCNFLHLNIFGFGVYMVQRPLGCEIKVKYFNEKHCIYIQRLYVVRFCGFSSL